MTIHSFHSSWGPGNCCASVDISSDECILVSEVISWIYHVYGDYPGVFYEAWNDVPERGQFIQNYLATDNTLEFASWAQWTNKKRYLVLIRISGDTGFGLIIDPKKIDFSVVRIEEDDGNYWGDHESEVKEIRKRDLLFFLSAINETNLVTKDKIIDKLWDYGSIVSASDCWA